MALLRAPLLVLKWLAVALAVLVSLVVAPIVDVFVESFGWIWRRLGRRDARSKHSGT